MDWLMAQDTRTVVLLAGGAGLVAMALLMLTVRAAWRAADPPYEAVRRRPRQMEPWHMEPVAPRAAYAEPETQVMQAPRRSLDPDWREAVLETQPKPPARHRVEHHEETRAWKPADLRRAIAEREEDRG